MGVLQDVIAFKRFEREKELADIGQIGSAVNNFLTLRNQVRQSELNRLVLNARLRDIDSKIEARKPNPLEKSVERAEMINELRKADDPRSRSVLETILGGQSESPNFNVSLASQQEKANVADIDQEEKLSSEQSQSTDSNNLAEERLKLREKANEKDPITGRSTSAAEEAKFQVGLLEEEEKKSRIKSAAQEKRDVEIRELEGQVENLVTLFKSARREVSDIPGIGQTGPQSRFAGLVAKGRGSIGLSPKTNIFQRKLDAFATVVAKAAGEVRPTDRDIIRFRKTLLDISLSDAENQIIIDQLVADLRAKGAKAIWADRTAEIDNATGLRIFNSENEAALADLPVGTRIIILNKIVEVTED